MPFCPECQYEYKTGVESCPDCGSTLVETLPIVAESPDDVFVPLPDLPGRVYAEMVKGVLDQEGIPCYIRADGVSDGYGIVGTGPVTKGVRLFVPESRMNECLEIQHQLLDHI